MSIAFTSIVICFYLTRPSPSLLKPEPDTSVKGKIKTSSEIEEDSHPHDSLFLSLRTSVLQELAPFLCFLLKFFFSKE